MLQNDQRLLQLLARVKGWFSLTVLSRIFSGVITITMAWFLTLVIDGVFLRHLKLENVQPNLLWLILLAILKALFVWSGRVFGKQTTVRIKADLRRRVLAHLTQLGPRYVNGERTGELTQTLSGGVEKLDTWFSEYLPQLITAVVIPLIILSVVLPLDLLSGIVFLLTAPLIPFFMILIGQMAEKKTQRQWRLLSWMSAHFLDVLQGLTTLKILGRSKNQIKNIRRITDEYRQATMGVLKIAFLSALVLELVGTLSIAIIAVEVGLRLLYARLTFQSALFILLLAPEYYQPLRELGARFHVGLSGMEASRRLFAILETPIIETNASTETIEFYWRRAAIQFRQVSLHYPALETPVVADISFRLLPGRTTALAGVSGAGKSTIAGLLMGFLRPTTGDIVVGEKSIRDIPAQLWRRNIAWVPQKPHLFYGSLLDNLLLARPEATTADIDRAIRQAVLEPVIRELPQGLETVLGENGQGLSGGQAQRLAIARAILKDAPLLVLDEFSANLDVETEAGLLQSLQVLKRDRTTLIIAHRLDTIQHADQLIIMHAGRIVEHGKPAELERRKGLFAKMVAAYSAKDDV